MKGKRIITVEVTLYVDLDESSVIGYEEKDAPAEKEFEDGLAYSFLDAAEYMWKNYSAMEGYGVTWMEAKVVRNESNDNG